MGITPNLPDREFDKFIESPTRPNHAAVEVVATVSGEVEIKDDKGKTLQFSGSVGLSNVLFPAAPSGKIAECLIRNPDSNLINTKIYFSLDGGSNFMTLSRGEFIAWTPKNNASNVPIEQLVLKGSLAVSNYELIVNVEG